MTPNAIIQIKPDYPVFGVCLAIITETASWGVKACIPNVLRAIHDRGMAIVRKDVAEGTKP